MQKRPGLNSGPITPLTSGVRRAVKSIGLFEIDNGCDVDVA